MSTDLPSFLQETAPGRYTLTMSASAAETAMLCPAKYSWSRITGIEAAAPRAGMNYGKALHLALAHRYSHPTMSLLQVHQEADTIIGKWFAEHPQPELGNRGRPEWRTFTRALAAFGSYNAAYPAEDFEVVGVEEPFEVELGEFRLEDSQGQPIIVTVVFRGIRDLRVKWHDQLWVLDHKTSTEWSDLTVDEGRCSFQFQGYAWIEREAMRQLIKGWERESIQLEVPLIPPQVGGVIGNYLISREPYSNPDRKPTPPRPAPGPIRAPSLPLLRRPAGRVARPRHGRGPRHLAAMVGGRVAAALDRVRPLGKVRVLPAVLGD